MTTPPLEMIWPHYPAPEGHSCDAMGCASAGPHNIEPELKAMTTPTPRADAIREQAYEAHDPRELWEAEYRKLESDLAARITLDAQEKAALKGQADVLDALNTSQAHEIALLKTKLASVKAERDALKERIWQIRVELGALFTMLPNEVPCLAMEVCERDADRQCLFRAFELAAHKEGA